jgi:hypothetical protein
MGANPGTRTHIVAWPEGSRYRRGLESVASCPADITLSAAPAQTGIPQDAQGKTMKDTDAFHAPRWPSRGQRLITAWRGMARLGMLLDGRLHVWADESAASRSSSRKSPPTGRATRAPRLARLAA